jgi:putative colanic acid biosynthesis acetyltransferase WcaF
LITPANVSSYPSPHSLENKIGRVLWHITWLLVYRPSTRLFHGWRRLILRLFGARIGKGVHPYLSVRIWAPWNLEMGDQSCLGDHIDCYCVDKVRIGSHSTISPYSYLCTASHDYTDPAMPLITAPTVIGEGVWIAADVFVGPGVAIGDGVVIGARSCVFRNIEPWTVVAGNPAKFIKKRELRLS